MTPKETLAAAIEYQNNYEICVKKAATFIRKHITVQPVFGLVLGSGLGELATELKNPIALNYSNVPNFPTTTVPGHEGKLLIGELEGVPLIVLQGRKHFYEVADLPMNVGLLQTVFPVHVLAELGIKNYFVTNAAGGLNPEYKVGDCMVIKAHVNHLPNPLLGRQHKFLRVDNRQPLSRFQPMNAAYDPALKALLLNSNKEYRSHLHEGVYLAVPGPSYETESEVVAFRELKVDAVGMSTTPEVIIARSRGMNVVGLSCITNVIAADGTNATSHEEVQSILHSAQVKKRLVGIIKNFFRAYKLDTV